MSARVSVVIPVYNEGDHIIPVLDRLFEAITLHCEVLVVYDSLEDTTRPVLEEYAEKEPRLVADLEHLRAWSGPSHPVRPRQRVVAGARRDHGRRMRRCHADRHAHPSGRAGRGRGRRVPLHARRATGGRTGVQELPLADGRQHAVLVRPGRHARRHQLVQGLLGRLRARRRSPERSRVSRSGSSWWPKRAGRACRSPRSPRSGSTARSARRTSNCVPGCPATYAGTSLRSARSSPSSRSSPRRPSSRTAPRAGGTSRHAQGPDHRFVRLHRRLRRRGAAEPRVRGGRCRQLLQVRAGLEELRLSRPLHARRGRRARCRPDDRTGDGRRPSHRRCRHDRRHLVLPRVRLRPARHQRAHHGRDV